MPIAPRKLGVAVRLFLLGAMLPVQASSSRSWRESAQWPRWRPEHALVQQSCEAYIAPWWGRFRKSSDSHKIIRVSVLVSKFNRCHRPDGLGHALYTLVQILQRRAGRSHTRFDQRLALHGYAACLYKAHAGDLSLSGRME